MSRNRHQDEEDPFEDPFQKENSNYSMSSSSSNSFIRPQSQAVREEQRAKAVELAAKMAALRERPRESSSAAEARAARVEEFRRRMNRPAGNPLLSTSITEHRSFTSQREALPVPPLNPPRTPSTRVPLSQSRANTSSTSPSHSRSSPSKKGKELSQKSNTSFASSGSSEPASVYTSTPFIDSKRRTIPDMSTEDIPSPVRVPVMEEEEEEGGEKMSPPKTREALRKLAEENKPGKSKEKADDKKMKSKERRGRVEEPADAEQDLEEPPRRLRGRPKRQAESKETDNAPEIRKSPRKTPTQPSGHKRAAKDLEDNLAEEEAAPSPRKQRHKEVERPTRSQRNRAQEEVDEPEVVEEEEPFVEVPTPRKEMVSDTAKKSRNKGRKLTDVIEIDEGEKEIVQPPSPVRTQSPEAVKEGISQRSKGAGSQGKSVAGPSGTSGRTSTAPFPEDQSEEQSEDSESLRSGKRNTDRQSQRVSNSSKQIPEEEAPSTRSKRKPAKKDIKRKSPAPASSEPGPSTSRGTQPGSTQDQRKNAAWQRQRRMAKEIQRLQKFEGFLIPCLPFSRVVREIATDITGAPDLRFTADALQALQTATEMFLTSLFSSANMCANHARRVTVMSRDFVLLRALGIVD